MWGGFGNDELWGFEGDEDLYGGPGNDVMQGWFGDDRLFGGSGNDRMYGHDGNDVLKGEGGDDELIGWDGNDRLEGGAGNDRIWGGLGSDYMHGGLGNDGLYAWFGNDVLHGGNGRDDLFGHQGNDRLFGGNHNDYVAAGRGADRANGGPGDDIVHAGAGSDPVINGGTGRDVCTWNAGESRTACEFGRRIAYRRVNVQFVNLTGESLTDGELSVGARANAGVCSGGCLLTDRVDLTGSALRASIMVPTQGGVIWYWSPQGGSGFVSIPNGGPTAVTVQVNAHSDSSDSVHMGELIDSVGFGLDAEAAGSPGPTPPTAVG